MITLRRFEKSDWYGLCGSTTFQSTGNEPLIGSIDVEGAHYLVVFDGHDGGMATIMNDDSYEIYFSEGLIDLAFELKDQMTTTEFRNLLERFGRQPFLELAES